MRRGGSSGVRNLTQRKKSAHAWWSLVATPWSAEKPGSPCPQVFLKRSVAVSQTIFFKQCREHSLHTSNQNLCAFIDSRMMYFKKVQAFLLACLVLAVTGSSAAEQGLKRRDLQSEPLQTRQTDDGDMDSDPPSDAPSLSPDMMDMSDAPSDAPSLVPETFNDDNAPESSTMSVFTPLCAVSATLLVTMLYAA
jgi:hypothetical protein